MAHEQALRAGLDLDAAGYGEGLAAGARAPAHYAASAVASRGRQHPEPECPTRSPYQRDRDRILHSTPFRRLTYKTQVFVYHEGDHYRTRLTHSLEVAQIARAIARQLRLDEDLAEAIALAHDLGHSPFGHAGERALDAVMAAWGGFDHNAQSLRVVRHLERKYQGFDGLNLTWETLEGLAKHNGPVAAGCPVAKVTGGLAPLPPLELDRYASAEAQVAALSDDIAYVNHDIDDALRAGLLEVADLGAMPLVGAIAGEVLAAGKAEETRRIYEVTRRSITAMVADVVGESRVRLRRLAPGSPDDIRLAGGPVVSFSAPLGEALARLKAALFEHVYRHSRVMASMQRAEQIVADLFSRYMAGAEALPESWRQAASGLDQRARARLVGDFVAGMTDRYAIAEHRRLFDATPELR